MNKFKISKHEPVGFLMHGLSITPPWLNDPFHPIGYLLEGNFIFEAPVRVFIGSYRYRPFRYGVGCGDYEGETIGFLLDVNCESSDRLVKLIGENYDVIYTNERQHKKTTRDRITDLIQADIEAQGWDVSGVKSVGSGKWNTKLSSLIDIHYSIFNGINITEMAEGHGIKLKEETK